MIQNFFRWLDEFIRRDFIIYGLVIILILIGAFVLSRILRLVVKRAIARSSKNLRIDPTQYNFLLYGINLVIYITALILIFYTIPGLKALGLTLFASAGFITAILLFASQQALSNIISGVFIVGSKPFRVNDIIKVGDFRIGRVENITLRHTVIRDFENRRIIIPNSVINSETIINSSITDELICNFVEFGISYDSDVDLAREIIVKEATAHPNFMDHRTEEEKKEGIPAVRVRVVGFGDSSVNLRAFVWTRDHSSGFALKCDLFKSVKEEFDRQGVEIPFPYRTLVFKNEGKPEKLNPKNK
jgi:small conductance mechanosensitive channel